MLPLSMGRLRGYHHHLGTNVWAGPGARTPTEDDARLLEWTIVLPDVGSVEGLSRSLAAKGFSTTREGSDLITDDPWGTKIRIRTALQ